MYRVISIHNYAATRDVGLQNIDTKTVEVCFDDSAIVSCSNFNFISVGELYDCKIELFGHFEHEKRDSNVVITILESNVIIGNVRYFKVLVESDVYYIRMLDAKGFEMADKMFYCFTRKDLIQVGNIIHDDCFSPDAR